MSIARNAQRYLTLRDKSIDGRPKPGNAELQAERSRCAQCRASCPAMTKPSTPHYQSRNTAARCSGTQTAPALRSHSGATADDRREAARGRVRAASGGAAAGYSFVIVLGTVCGNALVPSAMIGNWVLLYVIDATLIPREFEMTFIP